MKHDQIIEDLIERLRTSYINYNIIVPKEEYDIGKVHGECDLYARNGDRLLLFEVKSRDTQKAHNKAIYQLEKDVKYYKEVFKPLRLFKFYVYGVKNNYKIKWIK